MSIIVCPKCREKLNIDGNSLRCVNNHSFDFSREGYVNLLLTNKSGDKKGDSKESAHARHNFLAKGYYAVLKNAIGKKMQGTVLDICCGEGYYDTYDGELYGFDISKEMVRLAAKSNKSGKYFVANLSQIPIEDKSIDTAVHLFAPFNDREFARILKDDGNLYSVIPGENHLIEMKELLYDVPYKNDEKAPDSGILQLVEREKVSEKVHISSEDLFELFSMTPYFYRTSEQNKSRLKSSGDIDLTVEFVILKYQKKLDI